MMRNVISDWRHVLVLDTAPHVEDVRAFFGSLSPDDLRARFGSSSPSSYGWLIERLGTPDRGIVAARLQGEVVAILDHVRAERWIEFGIVVQPWHRRRRIATALLERLLVHAQAEQRSLVAHAAIHNLAAVWFLRRHGFAPDGGTADYRRFRR